MKIVILDGYHAGEMAETPMPPLTFAAERPAHISKEEFWSEKTIEELNHNRPKVQETYHLTFVSRDGEVGLYTTTGRSADFLENPFIYNAFTENPFSGVLGENSAEEIVDDIKRERETPGPVDPEAYHRWLKEGRERFGVDLTGPDGGDDSGT